MKLSALGPRWTPSKKESRALVSQSQRRQQMLLFASSFPFDLMMITMLNPLNAIMTKRITPVSVLFFFVAIVVGLPKQTQQPKSCRTPVLLIQAAYHS